jgi:hypothetical protein
MPQFVLGSLSSRNARNFPAGTLISSYSFTRQNTSTGVHDSPFWLSWNVNTDRHSLPT